MTCGNPIKYKYQNAFNSFIDEISNERKLSDDQMECMQLGICVYSPKQLEEMPFFITKSIDSKWLRQQSYEIHSK